MGLKYCGNIMIKPPYGRQGNKLPLLDKILPLIPQHDVYVELFVGSGALFFNKSLVKSVLNDLDKDVYYRLQLIKKVPLFEFNDKLNTLNKLKKEYDKPLHTLEDKVIHEKIKSATGFNSKPITKSSDIYSNSNPYVIAKELPHYKKYLKNATLTNKDYAIILNKYDSPNTFFFIDPPYENTDKQFYSNTVFNYEELRDNVDKIKGLFMITLNDSPYIRKVFKGYKIKGVKIINSRLNMTGNIEFRKEIIIMNYLL
jgi:DNA adenine methylase